MYLDRPPGMPRMMPPGSMHQPQRPPSGKGEAADHRDELLGRSADILAVRAAMKEGKVLTLADARAQRIRDAARMPPPAPILGPRVSKAGNLPRERPAIGSPQVMSSETFGSQFQSMKKQVPQLDGESRKDYKKRIHQSIRAVKKGGKPVVTPVPKTSVPPKAAPKAAKSPYTPPPPVKRPAAASDAEGPSREELREIGKVDVPKGGVLKAGFVKEAAQAARKPDSRRVMLRMSPARGPPGFAAKVALKSREKADEQRRARLWEAAEDRGIPARDPEVYPW